MDMVNYYYGPIVEGLKKVVGMTPMAAAPFSWACSAYNSKK